MTAESSEGQFGCTVPHKANKAWGSTLVNTFQGLRVSQIVKLRWDAAKLGAMRKKKLGDALGRDTGRWRKGYKMAAKKMIKKGK